MSFRDLIVREGKSPVDLGQSFEETAHRLKRLTIYNGSMSAVLLCTGEVAWGIVEEGAVTCPDCLAEMAETETKV
jgi:hypothetical protein